MAAGPFAANISDQTAQNDDGDCKEMPGLCPGTHDIVLIACMGPLASHLKGWQASLMQQVHCQHRTTHLRIQ